MSSYSLLGACFLCNYYPVLRAWGPGPGGFLRGFVIPCGYHLGDQVEHGTCLVFLCFSNAVWHDLTVLVQLADMPSPSLTSCAPSSAVVVPSHLALRKTDTRTAGVGVMDESCSLLRPVSLVRGHGGLEKHP